MASLVFTVNGLPAPQGSKIVNAHGGVRESSKALAPWREAIRHEAAGATPPWWDPGAGPFAVVVVFTMRRPAWHYGTGRNAGRLKASAPRHPSGKPDVDKLARAVLDALTDSGAMVDDSQVCNLSAVKCYPGGDLDALDHPGAVVTVWGLEP